MEHNTPGALYFVSLLSPSLQDSTPQVKSVSIAFRYEMTETLADFEKLYETEITLLTTEKYLRIRAGRLNDPLLRIPLENVIPDELHLMLRITDVLTHNLIYAAGTYDIKNG